MRRPSLLATLMLFLPLGCAKTVFVPDATPGWKRMSGDPARGDRPYYVYLPKDWSADRKWPVVVYLHGAGERGTDPARPAQTGVGKLAWREQGAFPAIVLIPQAGNGEFWGMPETNARVLRALDVVLADYAGDPSRVYLTGNSLGGFGTWFLGALHPERFAALVPICGGVRGRAPRADAPFAGVPDDHRAAEIARRIGHTPVWIFHGKKDLLVPVAASREMHDALKAAGGDVRYTEYPDVGHESWDRAYAEPLLWPWVFAQHRRPVQ